MVVAVLLSTEGHMDQQKQFETDKRLMKCVNIPFRFVSHSNDNGVVAKRMMKCVNVNVPFCFVSHPNVKGTVDKRMMKSVSVSF